MGMIACRKRGKGGILLNNNIVKIKSQAGREKEHESRATGGMLL